MNSEDRHNGTILVVDDLPATINVVRTALEETGYDVLVATSGAEALKRAALTIPDLILLDLLMPGLDGYETCQQLKTQAATQNIPVIFMTVVATTFDKVKGFQLGAVDYLTKPIDVEELLARVKTHLTIARLRQELQEVNAVLEQQVAARTAELQAANAQLQIELAERQRAGEALKETNLLLEQSARFTKALLSAIPTPVFYKDKEGRYLGCNHAFFEMMGVTSEEIKGKTVDELWPSEDARTYHTKDLELMRNPVQQVYEFKVRDKYGADRLVVYAKNVFRDENDHVAGIIGVFLDITERKQAEEEIRTLNQELEQRVFDRTAELEASNKELADFSYTVSHNLRAPLRHLDGFLELLKQRAAAALDEQSRHYLDTIAYAAKRMGMLIDDLLSFSRMGRTGMTIRPVELASLVSEVIQYLTPDTAGRKIHWQIADLPVVTGDRAMLRMALVNLLANALKFTRRRDHAEIEIGCQSGQGPDVVIFVRDNGAGFDMAYADKLFGVFQRLHRTDEFEGTGIGLANVRRIFTRHGGRTWAEGKVDQGATFYCSLPQTMPEA